MRSKWAKVWVVAPAVIMAATAVMAQPPAEELPLGLRERIRKAREERANQNQGEQPSPAQIQRRLGSGEQSGEKSEGQSNRFEQLQQLRERREQQQQQERMSTEGGKLFGGQSEGDRASQVRRLEDFQGSRSGQTQKSDDEPRESRNERIRQLMEQRNLREQAETKEDEGSRPGEERGTRLSREEQLKRLQELRGRRSGEQQAGEQQGGQKAGEEGERRLSREEQLKRLQELRGRRSGEQQAGEQQGEQKAGEEGERRLSREEQLKRLRELREKKSGEQAQGEQQGEQKAGEEGERRLSREEQLKRLRELREKKSGEQAQGEQQGEQTAGEEGERRLSREEQLKRLQELREKKSGEQAQGEQQGEQKAGEEGERRLSREEQLKRLRELREKKSGEQAQGEQQGEQKAGEEGERRLSREEQLKRLQELREKKSGEQAQGEQKPDEQAGEKPLEIRQLSREEQFQKLQELRKARRSAEGEIEQAASKAKLEKLRSTLSEEQQKKLDAILAERGDQPIDRSNLRELLNKVRGEDTETARKRDLELSREKLTLLGSDVSGDKLQKLGFLDRKITREDIEDRLGRLDRIEARDRLSDAELSLLNEGRVPDRLRWRDRDRDGDTYNIININNINIQNNYFLRPAVLPPPPPRRGFGIDFSSGGFRFSYWDGRFCYDHDYAINVFVSLGKRRFDGFDGIIVGGRYYCYGWGWIDGCIDYGDCRIWVPGFWVPYTVEVCGPVDVWVPPVYEWVWTGCCWEQIQVDGGYFRRTMGDCRYVTRHYWVPGHYEYYRC